MNIIRSRILVQEIKCLYFHGDCNTGVALAVYLRRVYPEHSSGARVNPSRVETPGLVVKYDSNKILIQRNKVSEKYIYFCLENARHMNCERFYYSQLHCKKFSSLVEVLLN